MLEFFEVRRILEAAAVEKATALATKKDLAELQDQLDNIREIIDSSPNLANNETINQLVDYDTKFHQTLLGLAHNSYLTGLTESLSSRANRIRIWHKLAESGSIFTTLNGHQMIINAMVARDPNIAKTATVQHVNDLENFAKKIFSAQSR